VSPDLRVTLIKVGAPLLAIVVVLAISRARGLDLKKDIGLQWPRPKLVALWMGVWIVWIAMGEWLGHLLHFGEPSHWKAYAAGIVVLRVLAIGILGPAAEELVFRGILFSRLLGPIGPAATIVATAATWAALHYSYDWRALAQVCADGLVLGLARYRSRSTNVPIAMHAVGNLFSIYQSLHA
jgi:membrane protease YdiL (CAAX protease family)